MEVLIVLAIILLFFGAKRVPQLGRSLGSSVREFRKVTAEPNNDKDEVPERNKGEERLARDGAAHGGMHRTEDANTSSTEQKS